jgi:hypothetical protein
MGLLMLESLSKELALMISAEACVCCSAMVIIVDVLCFYDAWEFDMVEFLG